MTQVAQKVLENCTPLDWTPGVGRCWKEANGLAADVAAGQVKDAVGGVVGAVADSAVGQFAKAMMEGYDYVLKEFMTSWLGKGILVEMDGPSVTWFQQSMGVISVFLVTLGLMFAGIMVMKDRNGKPIKEVFENLGKVLFVTFAGTSLVQIFVIGADAFNKWILAAAGLSANVEATVVARGAAVAAPGVAILLGLFAILTVLIQWVLMFVRGALLPLLVGWWPVAAAASMLKGGDNTFRGVTRWILAFLIYSPVAACIYALAWRMKSGQEGIGGVINGWVLIVLAVLALPALLRLMTPAVDAVGRMAAGTMAMGIAAGTIAAAGAVGAAVFSGGASAAAGGGAAAKAPAAAAPSGAAPGGGGLGGGPGGGGGSPVGDGPSGASSVAQGGGAQGSSAGAQGALGDGGQSSSPEGAQPSSLVPAQSGSGAGGSAGGGSQVGGTPSAPSTPGTPAGNGSSGSSSAGGGGAPAGGASASAPTASQSDQVGGGSEPSPVGPSVASGASASVPPTAAASSGPDRKQRIAQSVAESAGTLAQGAAASAAKAEETMTD